MNRRELMQALAAGALLGLSEGVSAYPGPVAVDPEDHPEWPPLPPGSGRKALMFTSEDVHPGDFCSLDCENLVDGCMARIWKVDLNSHPLEAITVIVLERPNRQGYVWCLVQGPYTLSH